MKELLPSKSGEIILIYAQPQYTYSVAVKVAEFVIVAPIVTAMDAVITAEPVTTFDPVMTAVVVIGSADTGVASSVGAATVHVGVASTTMGVSV